MKELIGCMEEWVRERGKRKSIKKRRPYLAASTGFTSGWGVHKAQHTQSYFRLSRRQESARKKKKIPLADNHNNNSTVSQIHDSLSFPYEDENIYFSLAPCINAETAAGGWRQGWLQGFWQVSPCVTTDIIISRPESKVAICRRLKCTWSLQHT